MRYKNKCIALVLAILLMSTMFATALPAAAASKKGEQPHWDTAAALSSHIDQHKYVVSTDGTSVYEIGSIGTVDGYNGLAPTLRGYLQVSRGDFDWESLSSPDYGWYWVQNSQVDRAANGIYKTDSGSYYVKNGQVDFTYSGVAKSGKASYVIENGMVNTNANGGYRHGKNYYMTKNGKVTSDETAAAHVLDSVGWNLKAAYNWCTQINYAKHSPSLDPSYGTERFAAYGFKHKKGNCYVMAAPFYQMAHLMGYHVHQVAGYVPTRDGPSYHSWCEITISGTLYVVDPDRAMYRQNGYLNRYGQKGTWVYVKQRTMA